MRGAKDHLDMEKDLLIIKSNLQKLKLIQTQEEYIKKLEKELALSKSK